MLTTLIIKNFKVFNEVEVELGERVVFIGPNNSGKTSALQAIALWDVGTKRWAEKRGTGPVPEKRPGVTINRRDLVSIPVPSAKLFWKNLHVRDTAPGRGTKNIRIEIIMHGIANGKEWNFGLEYDYANEESIYCRPLIGQNGRRMAIPSGAEDVKIAYLPPMSGLAANETRLDQGAINVRLGEGRTAEVLRNLCWQVRNSENGERKWKDLKEQINALFGVLLDDPIYIQERGEITMTYREGGVRLDLSASGRGMQQTLLLLAYMKANPGSILLLDEPDAHLEILRQRQIYQILNDTALETNSQIIAASHSEVILNEAADRDIVIAFVGKPHRIDDRGSQVLKALKEIGFENYLQAEETGWVLYLEGSTDFAILKEFAKSLDHPVKEFLERPFVHYVGNQPKKAQEHFHALREAKNDLVGVGIYDHLDREIPEDPFLIQVMWEKNEIENYLCFRETLLNYVEHIAEKYHGELFKKVWRDEMEECIKEIETALQSLGKPSPWEGELKVSDDFFNPLFEKFFKKIKISNQMQKTDYHKLAIFVPKDKLDNEITEKLNLIYEIANRANPNV